MAEGKLPEHDADCCCSPVVACKRIALIHATPVAVPPVVEAFARLWPEAEVCNLLEDSLAPDLERASGLDERMISRFIRLARYAEDCGADGILFTCSAFGAAIEAAAKELAPLPVLKPNEAMFEEALNAGKSIGMVATFQPSVPSMEEEFEAMKVQLGSTAQLQTLCVPEAMTALRGGDTKTHNQLVATEAAKFANCDAVLLAQFSTAQAREAVSESVSATILTSPDSAVSKLRQLAAQR